MICGLYLHLHNICFSTKSVITTYFLLSIVTYSILLRDITSRLKIFHEVYAEKV